MAVDVLVVGAGPTGLALAAQLAWHGVEVRIVDQARDRAHESRALAIQPRTLEILTPLGVAERLVELGNPGVKLRLHAGGREVAVPLFDLGLADTAYPCLLFLSQAETERLLGEHLQQVGIAVERGVALHALDPGTDSVAAVLRHEGGDEQLNAAYVVGCDGARSAVRKLATIPFEGSSYPQTFVLADLEADGLARDAAHVFLSREGMLFFFPLVTPATWRLLAMRPPGRPAASATPELVEVQQLADAYTEGSVRLRDPVWMTNFRLHHRAATTYRAGRVFVAGDAAHIHSPAGAQGMNTGIQDAANLAWKLAQTIHGLAVPEILDTYDLERAPVGRNVLRFTDRAYRVATSTNPVIGFARTRIAPTALRLAMRFAPGRAYAFRSIAQLAIRYGASPLSVDAARASRRRGRPGDRLPDGVVTVDGAATRLHTLVADPHWTLLLCGPARAWPTDADQALSTTAAIVTRRLSADTGAGIAHDGNGDVLGRLGLVAGDVSQLLIRPDGHIAYRADGQDMSGLVSYLRRWLPGAVA